MEYAGLQDDNSRLSYSKLVHGHYTDPTLWLAHEALFQRWPITKVVKIVPYDEELSRAPPPSSITKLTNQADLSTILIPCSKRTRVDMTSLRDMRDIKPILNFNCKFGSWLDMLRYQKNQVTFIVPDELENDTTKSWNDHVKRESDWFQWPEEEVCEVLGRIKIISESDAKTQGSEVEGSDGWSSPTT
ncbi:hypothetical protein BCR39DRAFT_545521 [Naematelia encephala]|uniref:Uncharacterized protein n=1 Tax=Naematelia encephala TaxID=71784 RepID=A0A1Y2AQV1_9TREE|nr:hypothetical protein BCR39DRAFT_545521 [Naematelia encephala]